jgi:hypothetical protein
VGSTGGEVGGRGGGGAVEIRVVILGTAGSLAAGGVVPGRAPAPSGIVAGRAAWIGGIAPPRPPGVGRGNRASGAGTGCPDGAGERVSGRVPVRGSPAPVPGPAPGPAIVAIGWVDSVVVAIGWVDSSGRGGGPEVGRDGGLVLGCPGPGSTTQALHAASA